MYVIYGVIINMNDTNKTNNFILYICNQKFDYVCQQKNMYKTLTELVF